MSLAMILIQQNDTSHPKLSPTREIYKKIISDKHADAMAKFGAALSQGIIDAGGRNVTISMQNKSKSGNMPAIVGMALFNQFWYWFPLAHCLSLAFTPTAIIGVNKDLQVRLLSILRSFFWLLTLSPTSRSPNLTSSPRPSPPSSPTNPLRSLPPRRRSRRLRRRFSRRLRRRVSDRRRRRRLRRERERMRKWLWRRSRRRRRRRRAMLR